MDKILFISFIDVNAHTGNHLRERQLLSLLASSKRVYYMNIYSGREDVVKYLEKLSFSIALFSTGIIRDNMRLWSFRFLYILNVLCCTKLRLYKNYRFFWRLNLKIDQEITEVCSFYSVPFHFLRLYNMTGKSIMVDTNDIMMDRHAFLGQNIWWSCTSEDEMQLNRKNVRLLFISDNDQNHYLSNSLKGNRNYALVPFWLEPKNSLRRSQTFLNENSKITVGFIGSNNPYNREMVAYIACIAESCPNLQFLIAGGVDRQGSLHKENIGSYEQPEGTDYLKGFYDAIDVVFAPTTNSSGIKTKIIEGLSYDKAVIINKPGFDSSLNILLGKSLFIYDECSDFEETVKTANNNFRSGIYNHYVSYCISLYEKVGI